MPTESAGANPRVQCRCLLAAAVCLPALSVLHTPADAQPATNANRTVNLNYVYASQLGFGGYRVGGLTADVFTLPYRTTLPLDFGPGWSIRLSVPLQLGLYSFKAVDTDGTPIKVDQQSIALVPGAELNIPLGSHVMIKPFVDAGAGRAFGTSSSNPNAWLYATGVRAVTEFQAGQYTLSLGNGLILAGDQTMGSGFSETYSALETGFEVRRPLGFQVAGLAPDLGVYAADYYYPKPLVFSRFLSEPLRVRNQVELGFSVGSAEPFEFLWFKNARIGAGYVFGNGLQVWRVNFGFPF
ncbi:MAG: hypothetical protein JO227_16980 [Acetobacteraceae bacterium]|nr:hypothetical protein [Acetobacteraceae bacterium]